MQWLRKQNKENCSIFDSQTLKDPLNSIIFIEVAQKFTEVFVIVISTYDINYNFK